MRKSLLLLGSMAAIVAPIVAVVSCSPKNVGFTLNLSNLPQDRTEREAAIQKQIAQLKLFAQFHAAATITVNVKIDDKTVIAHDLKMDNKSIL